jgi:glycosyltransferase involved in cell wall biosynthesis
LDASCIDQLAHHHVMLAEVLERADQFDVIHFHVDYLHFPLYRICNFPGVTTLHGRLDIPDLRPLYMKYRQIPLVSISHDQRKPLRSVNWIGNVPHGLPSNLLSMGSGSGAYLAFLGRISPEKRLDRAIEIALKVGMPLKIAAKVDRADREYFAAEIKPLLNHPDIEYIGEITEKEKSAFLGNAFAYLFPIDWPEPFGLTMIEAMACGTPTIAFQCGSVPEVITPGVSGIIVNSISEAIHAVSQVSKLSRLECRREFEKRFTAARMARDYVKVYEAVLPTTALSHASAEIDSCLTI